MTPQEWLALAAVVVPTVAAALTAWLNHRAQEGITNRIDGVDGRSAQRDEAHRQVLESIARDVSFMAGRQTERDQAAAGGTPPSLSPTWNDARFGGRAAAGRPWV